MLRDEGEQSSPIQISPSQNYGQACLSFVVCAHVNAFHFNSQKPQAKEIGRRTWTIGGRG